MGSEQQDLGKQIKGLLLTKKRYLRRRHDDDDNDNISNNNNNAKLYFVYTAHYLEMHVREI